MFYFSNILILYLAVQKYVVNIFAIRKMSILKKNTIMNLCTDKLLISVGNTIDNTQDYF